MTEQWAPVPGYEGRYEVSDLGRVRTVARVIPYIDGRLRRVQQRVRKVQLDTRGYPALSLTDNQGRTRTRGVHVLVAAAWIGPRPEGMEVCHNDGDKTNPRLDNLRYGTHSENAQDAVLHGQHPWASRTSCIYGHPYTPENTYPYRGRRHCRTCTRARLTRSKAKRRSTA